VAGSIVTVKFELTTSFTLPQVTVPAAVFEYVRIPIQIGDKGIVIPASVRLGYISGLGGGTPPELVTPANLSSLLFMPVSSKNWSASEDPNKLVLYGPSGAILRTLDKASEVTVSSTGTAIKVPAGKSLSITTMPLAATGLGPGSLWNSGGQVMVVP
jgi:hypothetical protein